jgi:hypothetical protein
MKCGILISTTTVFGMGTMCTPLLTDQLVPSRLTTCRLGTDLNRQ